MQITLDTMEVIAQDAFEQFMYGNDKIVHNFFAEINQVAQHNDALADMFKSEFNSCWNTCFVQSVLNNQNAIAFPENVEKYPSQWLLLWKEYFNAKFYQTQTSLKERDFTEIEQEVCILKVLLAAMPKDFNYTSNQSVTNLLASIPYSSSDDKKYDEQACFECAVFALAKMENEQFFYDNASQDMEIILRAYYAQYKQARDDIIFKTYISNKTDETEVIAKKREFFRPKTNSERLFIGHLITNRDAYIEALNQVGGLRGKSEQAMKASFESIFVEQNFLDLQRKLVQKTHTSKKSKI